MRFLLPVWVFLFLTPSLIHAQDTRLPTIYIDCDSCDQTFLRRELDFVNHVRDQADADIYVLITTQTTASGGRSYVLAFDGNGPFEGIEQTLRHTSPQSETDDDRRVGLTQVIRMGAMPYLSQTAYRERFAIGFLAGEVAQVSQAADDPWNNWVFRFGLGGNVEAEESQDEIGFDADLRASRITDDWKFILDGEMEIERETFENSDESIVSTMREFDADAILVKSLSPRWSVGAFADVRSTTFSNLKARLGTAGAIEYNVFPWVESDRRTVALGYFAGVRHYTYFEETLFGKTKELLSYHSLRLESIFEQPWGEVFARLEGFQFLHDLSKNSVEFFTFVDVRITRGLSIFVRADAQLIHDQIFLPREGATLEEVLLRQQQLATNFEIGGSLGLRFTFGSIYNNVVNPRL